MKFSPGNFLRCKNDCCDGIYVVACLKDTGQEAEVVAVWHTRIGDTWRQVSTETQFRITKRQYPLWRIIQVKVESHEPI